MIHFINFFFKILHSKYHHPSHLKASEYLINHGVGRIPGQKG